MALRFFNTLSREKEEFTPLSQGTVRMYTCGPTVYNYAHIGNYRTYAFEDLLRRYLKFKGFRVVQVMNITDIDDKTIRDSQAEGISLAEFTGRYTEAFFQDLDSLFMERAEHYPRATEHVPEMVAIIEDLMQKGYAYKGEDQCIYYDISKFKDYGNLAHMVVEDLKIGARVAHDEYEKEHAGDFALWKAWDEQDGPVFWETSLGKGRPGWHIECSAMSMKYLGGSFDIHTGGVDNIFPHHQNEIAQSEAHTGCPFVRYWLHAEHLIVDGRKMSKSLGNTYTLREVREQGFSPLALRYLYISSHYRSRVNYTQESMEASEKALVRLRDFLVRLSDISKGGPPSKEIEGLTKARNDSFAEAMDDDLNSPQAVAVLFELVREVNTDIDKELLTREDASRVRDLIFSWDNVLGLQLSRVAPSDEMLPHEIEALMEKRKEARRRRDWNEADAIRDELKKRGVLLEDGPAGTRWKKAEPTLVDNK